MNTPGEGKGEGDEMRWEGWGRKGRGRDGLLKFHLIFQKSRAEPGDPS